MSATLEDRMPAYAVAEHDHRYQVVDGEDRAMIECADAHSAGHYAALMNRAFAAGYRAGYRDSRSR